MLSLFRASNYFSVILYSLLYAFHDDAEKNDSKMFKKYQNYQNKKLSQWLQFSPSQGSILSPGSPGVACTNHRRKKRWGILGFVCNEDHQRHI